MKNKIENEFWHIFDGLSYGIKCKFSDDRMSIKPIAIKDSICNEFVLGCLYSDKRCSYSTRLVVSTSYAKSLSFSINDKLWTTNAILWLKENKPSLAPKDIDIIDIKNVLPFSKNIYVQLVNGLKKAMNDKSFSLYAIEADRKFDDDYCKSLIDYNDNISQWLIENELHS